MSRGARERIEAVRAAMPPGGLFAGKVWRDAPDAFPISPGQLRVLEDLGERLRVFLEACNLIYRRSLHGDAPEWIARWLDAGKPQELLEISRHKAFKTDIPAVIRPDLILTDDGFALAEIDSVPGGIGLTAWMNRIYAGLGCEVVGGAEGMWQAAHRLLPEGSVVISEEASAYAPEMEWLFGAERVRAAEHYRFHDEPVYRFFEAFDWENLPGLRESWHPGVRMTAPLKPFLEEKLWLALFWMRPLREMWKRELGARYQADLETIIPFGWVVNPEPLPPHGVLPGLEAHSWEEVKHFSQRERDLVLKISGFSELAWGSRGVVVGSDVPSDQWTAAVDRALGSFDRSPYLMQRFRHGTLVEHPVWNDEVGEVVPMKGRVRLCPYYFVEDGRAVLKGIQATMCPADKKLIHGMQDAVMMPVRVAD